MGFFWDRPKKVKKPPRPEPPPPHQHSRPRRPSTSSPASSPSLSANCPPLHPGQDSAHPPWHHDAQHLHSAGPFGLGSFQPAGYLPAPPGWDNGSPPQYQGPYGPHQPPIVVNQHYYLTPPLALPAPPASESCAGAAPTKVNLGSVLNLASDLMNVPHLFDDSLASWQVPVGSPVANQGAAYYDQLSRRFDDVLTLIDRDRYVGNECDLFTYQPNNSPPPPYSPQAPESVSPAAQAQAQAIPKAKRSHQGHQSHQSHQPKHRPKAQSTLVSTSVSSGNYFAKVDLYSNAKLPLDLPPLRLYIATYRLLHMAAKYSERVYERPRGAERDAHVEADWRTGTKAMVIKSMPMDNANVIVFAIRGTASFMDWTVNLNMAPTSPAGFLDDPGNLCHAGFLSVARNMVRSVAARLRQLIEEHPGRASYSLLITGHSAGGAVASLLYSHMMSTSKEAASELTAMVGCFRRVHCITFGTPPISLLPLVTPDRKELKKNLFLSFVNEGDPVTRADKAYVKSLLELYATPPPTTAVDRRALSAPSAGAAPNSSGGSGSKGAKRDLKSKSSLSSTRSKSSSSTTSSSKVTSSNSTTTTSSSNGNSSSRTKPPRPVWHVPPCTLSNAGRIVVLRSGDPKARLKGKKTVEERLNEGVVAQVATDEQLRAVVWGDPVCHVMRLYAGRIETLAIGAVVGKD